MVLGRGGGLGLMAERTGEREGARDREQDSGNHEVHAHVDARTGQQGSHGGASHRAEAPEPVQAGHDRSAVEPLDGDRVRVHDDVEQAAQHPEHREADRERDEVAGKARPDDREAEQRRDHPQRQAGPGIAFHPSGQTGSREHAGGQPAERDAQVAVVQAEVVTDRGDPGRPGRERRRVRAERHPDRDPSPPQTHPRTLALAAAPQDRWALDFATAGRALLSAL